MKKVLVLAALMFAGSNVTAQTNASASPYIKILSVTSCYYVSEAQGGGNVWLPAIQVKFVPKQDFSYVELSGTFVDTKTSESLGKDMTNETELETGVSYTFLLHSSTGWMNAVPGRPIRVTPKFTFSNSAKGLYSKEVKISPVTKFEARECR